MKIVFGSAVAMLTLVSTVVPLSAHHSWPVNRDKLVTVKGTVKQIELGEPPSDVHHRGPRRQRPDGDGG